MIASTFSPLPLRPGVQRPRHVRLKAADSTLRRARRERGFDQRADLKPGAPNDSTYRERKEETHGVLPRGGGGNESTEVPSASVIEDEGESLAPGDGSPSPPLMSQNPRSREG